MGLLRGLPARQEPVTLAQKDFGGRAMDSEDIKRTSNLEIMRRIVALMPENTVDRERLRSVIAGLSTPDTWQTVDGEVVSQTEYIPRARALLKEVLPRLVVAFPDEPLVVELRKRYPD